MKFEIEADQYCWILTMFVDSKDKHGNHKQKPVKTYHANLEQVSNYILRQFASKCDNVEQMRELFSKKASELCEAITFLSEGKKPWQKA